MEIWKIESNPGKQMLLAVAIFFIGLLLIILCRDYGGPGMTNTLAGFLLGWLLFLVGAVNILLNGKQTIIIDPQKRCIAVLDANLFGNKARYIPFHEIVETRVAAIGKRSSYTMTYYVSLHLRDGKTYPLFFPAYYDGRWDRSVAEYRLQRLGEYLQPVEDTAEVPVQPPFRG